MAVVGENKHNNSALNLRQTNGKHSMRRLLLCVLSTLGLQQDIFYENCFCNLSLDVITS